MVCFAVLSDGVRVLCRCLDECRTLFAGRSSVDLMYGRPGQSLADWTHELNQVRQLHRRQDK